MKCRNKSGQTKKISWVKKKYLKQKKAPGRDVIFFAPSQPLKSLSLSHTHTQLQQHIHTHIHTHTHTHTHTHILTHIHTHSVSLVHTNSHLHTLSLSHTKTYTHSLSYTRTHTLFLSLENTQTHFLLTSLLTYPPHCMQNVKNTHIEKGQDFLQNSKTVHYFKVFYTSNDILRFSDTKLVISKQLGSLTTF